MPSVPAYGWDERIRKPWREQGDKVHCAGTREQTLAMIKIHQEMCQKCPIAPQIFRLTGFSRSFLLSWRFAETFILNNSSQILYYVLRHFFNLGICIQQVSTLGTFFSLNNSFPSSPSSLFAVLSSHSVFFPVILLVSWSSSHLYYGLLTNWLKTEDRPNSCFCVFLNKSDSVDW